jgi:hypothetical protein
MDDAVNVEVRQARLPEPESNGKAAALDLETRYAKLTHIHKAHLDIFGDDPRPRLEPLRGEASRALKSLQAEGSAEAASAEAIESFLSRLGSFRRRWGEIREVFLDEYRSFRTTQGVWASRERLVASAKGAQRKAAEKQWADRLDIALTIAEQRAAALEAAEPEWLPKESRDLAAIWGDLRVSAEADLARARTAAARPKAAKTAQAPEAAKVDGRLVEEAEAPDADLFTAAAEFPEEAGGTAKEPAPVALSPRDGAAAEAPSLAPPPSAERLARRRESPPESEEVDGAAEELSEEEGERPATSRSWMAVVWSAAGFGAATLVFGLLGRRRRLRQE